MSEIEIPKLREINTIGLFGPVASGKTWLQEQLQSQAERSLAIDASSALITKENYTHIFGNPEMLAQKLLENPFYYRIAYHPQNFEADFDWCSRLIWLADNGKNPPEQLPRYLIVDEIQRVCGFSGMLPMMQNITQLARHVMLGFIGAAQRISQVHKDFTSACRTVILFNTIESNDHEAIRERFGRDVLTDLLSCRECIYNDVQKTVEQTPECIVWIRGLGHRKFSLGNKIKPMAKDGTKQWETEISRQHQMTEEESSSPEDSGRQEQKLPDDSQENA